MRPWRTATSFHTDFFRLCSNMCAILQFPLNTDKIMAFDQLSIEDQKLILQCMRLVLESPYIRGGFEARLGMDRGSLKYVIENWPNLNDDEPRTRGAINNCLNEVANGISLSPQEWDAWFEVPRDKIKSLFFQWRALKGYS